MNIEKMTEVLEQMLTLWADFDLDGYTEITGDDEAGSRIGGTLRRMLSDLLDGEEGEEDDDD